VWTTHAWLADGFRASGVHVPIRLMPLGTAAAPLDPPWHAGPPGDPFTFLLLANLQPRKAVVETAEAFVAAFGGSGRVRLRVHGKWGDTEVVRRMESFRRFGNVRVTLGTLAEAEMAALWREADCAVSLSKGEGWGLVPREALALGLPVIVSALPCWEDLRGHSAQGGGGEGRAWFVETAGREEAAYGFTVEDTGRFFTVEAADARRVMRAVYRRYAGAPRRPPVAADVSPTWAEAGALYARELDKEVLACARSLVHVYVYI
jgi:glycosyltransferase involved in cell wall biosynthesis